MKYKATVLRDQLDRYEPRAHELDHIDDLLAQAGRIRDQLVTTNLPMVLSVTRRHLAGHADATTTQLIELLEIGNQVLIDAVDQFNVGRDQPFGSYLSFVLMRELAREASRRPTRKRARARLTTDAVVQRMRNLADESGIDLQFNAEEDD